MSATIEEQIASVRQALQYWNRKFANDRSPRNRRMRAEIKRALGDLSAIRYEQIRNRETQSKESFV